MTLLLLGVFSFLQQASPAVDPDFPTELVSFEPSSKPLLASQGPGHWDALIRERGWILREPNGYRLWYTGYIDKRQGPMSLGLATSPDGIHWTRASDRPIYDEAWVEDVQVIHADGAFLMVAEGKGDQAQLLTSKDGVAWERVGILDIRQTNGKPISPGPFGTPTLFREGTTWNLFYERMDRGVWRATSKDLKVWTHVRDEPVLVPGPGPYDAGAIAFNQVVPHGGRYFGFYHGLGKEGPGRWCTCVAVSEDLQTWRKYAGNPLTPPEKNESSGIVVQGDEGYRLYTMHPEVRVHLPKQRP